MNTNVSVMQLTHPSEKAQVARTILAALPAWFGIPEATERYIQESTTQPFFVAMDGAQPVGFLCLKETSPDTVELAVMGVYPARHGQGVGTALFERAKRYAQANGYAYMQVKTVAEGHYEEYDRTNRFYRHVGFKALEVFPTLWDEWNPCLVYVMKIG